MSLRLVILGGDGSLLEVLNCLVIRAQKEVGLDYDQPTCKLKPLEVPIGIIPTGGIEKKNDQEFRIVHNSM